MRKLQSEHPTEMTPKSQQGFAVAVALALPPPLWLSSHPPFPSLALSPSPSRSLALLPFNLSLALSLLRAHMRSLSLCPCGCLYRRSNKTLCTAEAELLDHLVQKNEVYACYMQVCMHKAYITLR